MISQRTLTLATALVALAAAAPHPAHAQALPTQFQLVSGLDLECYRTPGPSLDRGLMLTHLNRVLVDLGLPPHQVTIRELAQTCVPVRKNNGGPVPAALPFDSQIDLACYRIDADPLPTPVSINLNHLNPLLAGFPTHNVVLQRPVQLCVPVAKNDIPPMGAPLALAQFVDLECYQTAPGMHPPLPPIGLTQLNPQLTQIPPHQMTLALEPRQLCVPVRKNNQFIPQPILDIVQWIDLEKFAANPPVQIAPVNVLLSHLNPLFVDLPKVQVVLQQAIGLMVPVAKNAHFPPND
jgi:hypothetical protein